MVAPFRVLGIEGVDLSWSTRGWTNVMLAGDRNSQAQGGHNADRENQSAVCCGERMNADDQFPD
jgi:hypothetical protein